MIARKPCLRLTLKIHPCPVEGSDVDREGASYLREAEKNRDNGRKLIEQGFNNDLKPIFSGYLTLSNLLNVCPCLGKSQVMGEIKIALKKEMKTEGEHLVLEILQCRNITYKFKTPDHLPGNGK